MLYNPPTGGAANDPYVGKNVTAGIQGSKVPPAAVEYPQREIVAVITAAGLSPTNTDLTQLLESVRSGVLEFYLDTGTADALIITPSPAFSTIADGTFVTLKKGASANATATPALAANGLSQPIVKQDGTALAPGDLPANSILSFRSLGGHWYVSGLRKSDATLSDSEIWHIGQSAGSSTAYTTTLSPVPTAAVYGLCMRVYMNVVNGAAPTLDFGFGPKPIVRNDTGTALVGGEMSGFADLTYNGSALELMNPGLPSAAQITNLSQTFVTKGTSADFAQFSLASNQAVTRNVITTIGVSGSNPSFGTLSGGVLTITTAGKYAITGTFVTTSVQPSGELQYVSGYIYKNGSLATSQLVTNPSYGSSATANNMATALYLNVGDQISLCVFMHSSSNDDTSDTVVGGGSTFLTVLKIG